MQRELVEAIEGIYQGFSGSDSRALRKVNDTCIESLGIKPEKDLLSLAIISYVLSKILSKPRYFERKSNRQYLSGLKDVLLKCRAYSRSGRETETHECILGMLKAVEKLNVSDRRFFLGLQQKARLKIGATLYAQGFSLGRASEITGVETREILKYSGGSMMFDRLPEKTGIESRLRVARKIFAK